ncbi:N-(5'-phosphoribosyl)anthranilate isomerase [Candidatus Magnetobacterium bavaricum]|uniref:N-(5'-phosphoribosyl)anthranilate isomerase n=1 Tax=Candidatus Magnetobacterium bavaricum TaxID=29290 RepID=A0A0F3GVV8_9BACT|nr:N-(5'-phosphoribosyl)anthranilate isomerase [Candidatus Magnetobacterium bavaricum]
MKVKICGITNIDDAIAATEAGADALGFVFYDKSPRCVRPGEVAAIVRELPPFITTVGVFVNEAEAAIVAKMTESGLDVVQLHGDEGAELCGVWRKVIKAFRVREFMDLRVLEPYKVHAWLLDAYDDKAYGGTGKLFNWDIALEAGHLGRIVLAGGLTVENVGDAIRRVRPYAVDVSSAVEETKRKKNHAKIKAFITEAKRQWKKGC